MSPPLPARTPHASGHAPHLAPLRPASACLEQLDPAAAPPPALHRPDRRWAAQRAEFCVQVARGSARTRERRAMEQAAAGKDGDRGSSPGAAREPGRGDDGAHQTPPAPTAGR